MSPWRAAERAYYAHHATCGACKAAGQMVGNQPRCADGTALWDDYQAQPLPHVLAGRAERGGVVLGANLGANFSRGRR